MYLRTLTLLLFGVCLLSSCEKSEELTIRSSERPLEFSDKFLEQIYENSGTLHNLALDKLYNQLQQMHPSEKYEISTKEINEKVFGVLDVRSESTINMSDIDILTPVLAEGKIEFIRFHSLGELVSVSAELDNASEEIRNAIYNLWGSSSLNAELDRVLNKNISSLSNDVEKFALVSMVSVAKSSCQYWRENGEKWLSLKNTSQVQLRGNPWKNAAWADIMGAGTGAVRGAAIGLAGGTVAIPGLGTAVGGAGGVMVGMISGAIMGSAGAGISSVAQWIVGW